MVLLGFLQEKVVFSSSLSTVPSVQLESTTSFSLRMHDLSRNNQLSQGGWVNELFIFDQNINMLLVAPLPNCDSLNLYHIAWLVRRKKLVTTLSFNYSSLCFLPFCFWKFLFAITFYFSTASPVNAETQCLLVENFNLLNQIGLNLELSKVDSICPLPFSSLLVFKFMICFLHDTLF